MYINKITIENYRGINNSQEIPLSNFTSIVGKNDSGKSIILNAIASFIDPKSYPITEHDFNDSSKCISLICQFTNDDLKEILETKIKTKVKKTDGLLEFINDLIFEQSIIYRKTVNSPKKGFDKEELLIRDYLDEEFSMLYLKSDDELNTIIDKYSINIPVEGKGRNSKLEKIKFIKEYCSLNNKEIIKRFIDDDYRISTLFPGVEMFVSDYGLKADTPFKTNSVTEIQEYFERETSDESMKLRIVEKEIEQQMQNEAKSIKKYLKEYASTIKEVEIKPVIVWKDAIRSVDVNFQFEGDLKTIPMSHKGSGYRRLFMVARFRYLAEKNKGHNIIYLIEEPETFLHPSAQEDLLSAFLDLSEENQIIVTTHSPIFTGATKIDSIILCTKGDQSTYLYSKDLNDNEFIMRIIDDLGIKPSYNLRDYHEKIVFVEGNNDAKFYDIITKLFFKKSLISNKNILLLPFGGGRDIESFINIDYFDNTGRKLYLIIDSDKNQGNENKQKEKVDRFNLKPKGKGYMLKKSCIENYYHPKAFERIYSLDEDTFSIFQDNSNVKKEIKEIVAEKKLENKKIKEKNNITIFQDMNLNEWNEVLEPELIDFLKEIINK